MAEDKANNDWLSHGANGAFSATGKGASGAMNSAATPKVGPSGGSGASDAGSDDAE